MYSPLGALRVKEAFSVKEGLRVVTATRSSLVKCLPPFEQALDFIFNTWLWRQVDKMVYLRNGGLQRFLGTVVSCAHKEGA